MRKGNTVYKKVGKKLKKKATTKKAKKYLKVLNAVEHGWKPKKKKRGRRK